MFINKLCCLFFKSINNELYHKIHYYILLIYEKRCLKNLKIIQKQLTQVRDITYEVE